MRLSASRSRPAYRVRVGRLWQRLATHPFMARLAHVLGWRLVIPLVRWRARRRVADLALGEVTVITVNWNSSAYLRVLLDVVRRRSPSGVRILVVDNNSTDGSRTLLRGQRGVERILLPINLGHDLALDLGVLNCRSEYFITLDVDAFPLTDNWIETLLAPVQEGSAAVSGARLWRPYVHPCCLAMRTARFVAAGHSFRARYEPETDTEPARGDVGEELSSREAPRLHFLEITSQRGPGDIGTVFGDLVYHNFYGTRFGGGHVTLDGGIRPADPRHAWAEAVQRFVC
jgi:glycosyltransferase involved in cell wall biosynthesis